MQNVLEVEAPIRLHFDNWVKKYLPKANPLCSIETFDGLLYGINDPVWGVISKANIGNNIWTILNVKDFIYVIPGMQESHSDGFFITEVPWTDSNLEVVYWGHNDEINFIINNLESEDEFVFHFNEETNYLNVNNGSGEEYNIYPEDIRSFSFSVRGFDFVASITTRKDCIHINGILEDRSKYTRTIKVKLSD